MAGQKYYVVWVGKKPGVYRSWAKCYAQVKKFEGAKFKSFFTLQQAEEAFKGKMADYIGKKTPLKPLTKEQEILIGKPLLESISVDAACSGNPGKMEYRGVYTKNGKEIFHNGPFENSTQNIGEFLAIVHGLAFLKQKKSSLPLYSDSLTAMKWVKAIKVKTKLKQADNNQKIFELIDSAVKWLENNRYENRVIKWKTKYWGEISADFGRK